MLVYKFGGASIATPAAMQALLPLLRSAPQPLVLVVSAYGKTTNALEAVMQAACRGDQGEAERLATELEGAHLAYAAALFGGEIPTALEEELRPLFAELHWAAADATADRFDYSYDQIVSTGEL